MKNFLKLTILSSLILSSCSTSNLGEVKRVNGENIAINKVVTSNNEVMIEIQGDSGYTINKDFIKVKDSDGNYLNNIRFEEGKNTFYLTEGIVGIGDENKTGTAVAYYELNNSNSKNFVISYGDPDVTWRN